MRPLWALFLMFALQAPTQPTKRQPSQGAGVDVWLDGVARLKAKASSILSTELSRPVASTCDATKSTAEFYQCLSAEYKITAHHYVQFTEVLQATFAVPQLDVSPNIYPTGEKAFSSGEAAWRIYRDKTCEAVNDTYEGGTVGPLAEVSCKSTLTRQHMKELADTHLANGQ